MQDAISAKLVQILSGLQDSGGNTLFSKVVDYDDGEGKFDAWPVAMVLPDDMPSDLAQNTEVHRREGFNVFIITPLDANVNNRAGDYAAMRMLTDRVRNAIDDTIDLDGLRANPAPSGGNRDKVLGVVPVSAGWRTINDPVLGLMATVNVVVRYDHFTGN